MWHALGSNCCEGLYQEQGRTHLLMSLSLHSTAEFIGMLEKELPTAYLVSIRVGGHPSEDSYKSYFDNANRQARGSADGFWPLTIVP